MSDSPTISDPFFDRLTEALRAGPGTPAWHDAVVELRTLGRDDADELQLLMTAREHLASGKTYRSIRAGPEFTRRVMAAIDESPAPRRRGFHVAIIAALCIVAVAAAIYFVVQSAMNAQPPGEPSDPLAKLAATYFAQTLDADTFDSATKTYRSIGSLPIETRRGARPLPSSPATATGGGALLRDDLPASPIAIEATLRVQKPNDDLAAQIFVTDDSDFSDRGTTTQELAVSVQAGQVRVILPGGRVETQSTLPKDFHGVVTLRLVLDETDAVVTLQTDRGTKERVWGGPHQLDSTKTRQLGIRFLRKGDAKLEGLVFTGVKVLKP